VDNQNELSRLALVKLGHSHGWRLETDSQLAAQLYRLVITSRYWLATRKLS